MVKYIISVIRKPLTPLYLTRFFANLIALEGNPYLQNLLISMCNSVSNGATNKLVLNMKDHCTIDSAKEYEPDVLNTFSATPV